MNKLPLVAAAALALCSAPTAQVAPAPQAFTLEQVLDYPFADNLVAAPKGQRVAWTFNERGLRNIYAAEAPAFEARRLTPYQNDDGQELTHLAFSADGRTVVYVRGGDHGSNWDAEGNLQPNPTGSAVQPRMQVWWIAMSRGAPKLVGEGDTPAISPAGDRVAVVRDRQIYIGPVDGSKPAEQAFFARGTSESPVWSPDGRSLAFVSNRDDHSFIGIFTDATQPIRYLAASTSRDDNPLWSADGSRLAFVRQPGRGGTPQSPLVQQPQPWSIMLTGSRDDADAALPSWKSGAALVDSLPRTAGGANLHWAADDHLVFLSYQDGWPHLYSIHHPDKGTAPKLLTPGAFMVEHVSLSPDGRFLVYSANTGADRHDIDRRHVFKVPVDGSAPPTPLTSGTGLEWSPVVTGDGRSVAFLASTAQQPPLPAVMPIAGGQPRTIAARQLPADFPSAKLVTPEPVTFKASDGLEIHGQLFKTVAGEFHR